MHYFPPGLHAKQACVVFLRSAQKGMICLSSETRNPKLILVVAAFAAFLATFNETYLNVGFSPIMADLGVDVSTVQWLATAYMLGAAVMVPVSAFAYRSIPTRPLFCGTVAFLVVGSIIGVLAPGFELLLVGRVVQAIGTGMLIPIGMNITLEVAPRNKLGSYMGIMGSMTTLGPSLSVIVAGLLLSAFSWRMLLWVFAALSLLLLVCGAVLLSSIARLTHPKLDVASVILIGLALIGLMYGISTIFSSSIAVAGAAIVVGAVLMALFVKRQSSLEQPLLNLQPLKVPAFAVGVIINMLSLITMFAMNILVPTFMQSVLGIDSLIASLTLFPAIALCCVISPLAGRFFDKHGARTLLPCGFVLVGLFAVLVGLFINSGNIVLVALLYIPVICGSSLIIGPVQSFALGKLAPEMNPHGVTVMSTGFQIAGCLGSSVFTGIYGLGIAMQSAQGADVASASAAGFLYAAALVGVVAVVGLLLSLKVRSWEKAAAAAPAEPAAQTSPLGSLAAIMKREVYTLSPENSMLEALRMFVEKGISGAPVVDGESHVLGFVSDGDILSFLGNQHPSFKSAYSFAVEQDNGKLDKKLAQLTSLSIMEVATRDVISVGVNDGLDSVCTCLVEHHLKKAPVMDGSRMVGVINRSNINKFFVRQIAAS